MPFKTHKLHHKKLFKGEKSRNNTMNKWVELLLGLILVVVAVYVWGMNFWGMGNAALDFFKGGIVWFVIMIGLLFIMLGISDIKG